MKMRAIIAGTGFSARLTTVGCAALTILASASVSACTGSSPSATPTTFSPGATGSATPTNRPSGTASATTPSPSASPSTSSRPAASPSRSASPRPSASPGRSASPSRSASPFPTAAPATGGGGPAGFQAALLFGLGAAAIPAGAGGTPYRRNATQNRLPP